MRVFISEQAAVFFLMVLLGGMEGILYTFFQCLRKSIRYRWLAAGMDFLFWVLAGAVFLSGLYKIDSGEIRAYVLLGAFFGVLLYFLVLYRIVCTILGGVLDIIFKIFQFFFKILLTPGQLLYKLLIVPFCDFLKTKGTKKKKASDSESREKEE